MACTLLVVGENEPKEACFINSIEERKGCAASVANWIRIRENQCARRNSRTDVFNVLTSQDMTEDLTPSEAFHVVTSHFRDSSKSKSQSLEIHSFVEMAI